MPLWTVTIKRPRRRPYSGQSFHASAEDARSRWERIIGEDCDRVFPPGSKVVSVELADNPDR
ncbi:MAG TPA: hypothetical protein VEI97_14455 [bacterium]|nr:hypothetical protein [bacterium]